MGKKRKRLEKRVAELERIVGQRDWTQLPPANWISLADLPHPAGLHRLVRRQRRDVEPAQLHVRWTWPEHPSHAQRALH